MKKVLYLLVFSLLAISSMGAVPDFSGTWNLNKSKSTLNEQFTMAPNKIILTQTATVLESEKHGSFQDQEFITKEKLNLDGKESINAGWQDSQKKSTAVWSDDQKVLTVTSKIPMQDNEMVITEIYQKEAEQLKITVKTNSSFGDMSETYYFDKQ